MKVVIYGKSGCSFCEKSKMECFKNGVEFNYRQLDVDYTKSDLNEMIGQYSTYPQIFVNEDGFFRHVGGYQELSQMISE